MPKNMKYRVMLLHWKGDEIHKRVARLRKANCLIEAHSSTDTMNMERLRSSPPDAFVIDLSRLPSHGYRVAFVLRQQKATRQVPIVFVDGDPKKVAGIRKKLPDATFASWSGIDKSIKEAIRKPMKSAVVPVSTSGYSGTPLPKKLGVDGDRSVLLMGAPDGFERMIGAGDGDKRIRRNGKAPADVVMLFAKSATELKRGLAKAKKQMADGGGLWIAWPKKASGVVTDLSEDLVRNAGLAAGIVDYKVCAIDATWSGLKFARRR